MINNSDTISQSFSEKKRKDLMASLAIDALGMATYLVPALGETADVIIAPIISILIYAVHRTTLGAIAGFLEELIPFTDIIPSATIIWFYRYYLKSDSTFNDFVEKYRKKNSIKIKSQN
ncbi:MAG: hypothetical protein ACOVO2_03280 [Emticicia sp.]|uniref:hypothetical protein n=1 Tax=Emticicia sp. TaxID=1930953 RepID=UPI003BA62C37